MTRLDIDPPPPYDPREVCCVSIAEDGPEGGICGDCPHYIWPITLKGLKGKCPIWGLDRYWTEIPVAQSRYLQRRLYEFKTEERQ